jgi:hypothetical protein
MKSLLFVRKEYAMKATKLLWLTQLFGLSVAQLQTLPVFCLPFVTGTGTGIKQKKIL